MNSDEPRPDRSGPIGAWPDGPYPSTMTFARIHGCGPQKYSNSPAVANVYDQRSPALEQARVERATGVGHRVDHGVVVGPGDRRADLDLQDVDAVVGRGFGCGELVGVVVGLELPAAGQDRDGLLARRAARNGRRGGCRRCGCGGRGGPILQTEGLEDLGVRVALDDDQADRALVEGPGKRVVDEDDVCGTWPISSTTVPPPAGTSVVCDPRSGALSSAAS